MTFRSSSLAVAGALAVFVGAPAWTARDLGTPPGHRFAFVQGSLVNAHGTAVAVGAEHVGTNNAREQAFVWQRGQRTALVYGGNAAIEPVAIDAAGDVLGAAGDRAVRWHRGVPRLLGTFGPQAMSSTGDFVVGWSSGAVAEAFLWHRGTVTSLPGLGGSGTYAIAVNDSGTVVGSSTLPSGGEHAVVWRGGKPTDLGAPNGLDSTATFISANGNIFGFASQGASVAGVLEWRNGTLADLGSFGAPAAQPIALNAHGDVLVSTETGDQVSIGLRLLRDGKTIPIEVPALGRQHLYGSGLDDHDDVIGYGLKTGRGFLWRNGRVTLLPPGVTPVAVAGGWIVASNALTDRAVLLRRRT
jgi:probable HAF family extracellular repeat protein